MKLNHKFSLAAIIAIILLLVSYFVVIPAIQLSDYKKSSVGQNAVNDKMLRVYDNFNRDVFTKTNTKAASDKVDIDSGQESVKDALSALEANEKSITKFHPLPLLAWNKKYKTASDTNSSEVTYIEKSRVFLRNYTELLAYSQKKNVLSQEVEAITTDLDSTKDATTPAAAANELDTIAAKVQPVLDEDRTITPPAYLEASHTAELASITNLLSSLKGASAAARALDLQKLTTFSDQLNKSLSDTTKQEEQFITELHQKSTIAVEVLELRSLNDKIAKGYASL